MTIDQGREESLNAVGQNPLEGAWTQLVAVTWISKRHWLWITTLPSSLPLFLSEAASSHIQHQNVAGK